jgi:hypothetical protein
VVGQTGVVPVGAVFDTGARGIGDCGQQGLTLIPDGGEVLGRFHFWSLAEGGALRGALLPITVFLAVKVTGEAGLALWDRALVGVWLCRGAAEPPVLRLLIACTDSVEDQHAAASSI